MRSHPEPKAGAAAGWSHPHPRPGLAAGRRTKEWWLQAQEGVEELSHVEGQEFINQTPQKERNVKSLSP